MTALKESVLVTPAAVAAAGLGMRRGGSIDVEGCDINGAGEEVGTRVVVLVELLLILAAATDDDDKVCFSPLELEQSTSISAAVVVALSV